MSYQLGQKGKYNLEGREVIIYALIEKSNQNIFYVGRTTMTLKQRLCCHVSNNNPISPAYDAIMKSLRKRKSTPKIIELDRAPYEERKSIEEYWIQQIKAWGFCLVNVKHIKGERVKKVITDKYTPEEYELVSTLYRHGDNLLIAEKLGVSAELVRIYRNPKRANKMIKDEIVSFYEERAKRVSELYNAIKIAA